MTWTDPTKYSTAWDLTTNYYDEALSYDGSELADTAINKNYDGVAFPTPTSWSSGSTNNTVWQ